MTGEGIGEETEETGEGVGQKTGEQRGQGRRLERGQGRGLGKRLIYLPPIPVTFCAERRFSLTGRTKCTWVNLGGLT